MIKLNNIEKIGVLSDTHISGKGEGLPKEIFNIFKNTDIILHAGDFTHPEVITELESISSVIGVKGNMDSFDIRYSGEELIKINEKYLAAVCHGAGKHMTTKTRMHKKFLRDKPDIIIYGHTHKAEIDNKEGIIMFNPGSPAAGFSGPSVGIINITDKGLKPEIIFFSEKNNN
ncbi:MAG: metallophosphoesterase family protein [Candidatus Goldiibacteriota bacterium]